MDAIDAMLSRRSTRKYTDQTVPGDIDMTIQEFIAIDGNAGLWSAM